jgi:hypothetical protein
MFAVETYAAVRRFIFVEGMSRREAARVFGLSRETIAKMCRYSAPPGYVRCKAPERPKLGPLVPVIDAILEADKTAPPKQRLTAKRIFERLRLEHGFLGCYTVVKDYVRLARTSRARFSSRPPIRPATPRSISASVLAPSAGFRPAAIGCWLHQGLSGGDHGSLSRWATTDLPARI